MEFCFTSHLLWLLQLYISLLDFQPLIRDVPVWQVDDSWPGVYI